MTAPGRPRLLQRLGAWPTRHPRAAGVVLVLLFTFGTGFAGRIPVDPRVTAADATLRVDAELPGFDAATMETNVTARLEAALAGVPGLRARESRTRFGRAEITLRFDSPAARDRALSAVRTRVLEARPDLPLGLVATVVTPGERAGSPAIVYAVTASALAPEAVRWVRHILVDPLRELPEAGAITVEGLLRQEILIEPDPRRLATLGLAMDDLAIALRGDKHTHGSRGAARRAAAPGGVEAVASRAVRLPSGEPIALGELARVAVVPGENDGGRHPGEAPALRVTLHARSLSLAPQVAERAHAHLAWLRANDVVPADVVVQVLHDAGQATREWRRHTIARAGFVMALVLGLVFAVFGARLSAAVAIAFAAWLPLLMAAWWRLGFTFNTATAASALLALLPFALMMVLPASRAGVVTVSVAAAACWAAGLWLGDGGPASGAFAAALLLGVLIRWLIAAWTGPHDRRIRPSVARLFPAQRVAGRLLALAMLIPLYLAIVVAAQTLPEVQAEQGVLRLRLLGEDGVRVAHKAQSILPALHAIPRVEAVTSSARTEEAWRLHLDPERMAAAGIGPDEVGRALAIATEGLLVGEIASAEQKWPLRLRLPRGAAGESFERLLLRGARNKRPAVYLRQVGLAERIEEPRERLRVNGRPAVEITARWRGEEARARLEAFCGKVEVPAGYQAECAVIDAPY